MRQRWARPGNIAFAVLMAAAAVLWSMALRPQNLGGPADYVMVKGGSMVPTYHTGDLVVVHRKAVYAIGDIVAYRVPRGEVGAGLIVLHRIVGGSGRAGFVLRGDNNPDPDDWHPRSGDVVGTPWFIVPKLGILLAFLHTPAAMASLATGIVAAAMVGHGSRRPERAAAR